MYCFVSLFSSSFPLIKSKAFCYVLIKFVSSPPLPSSLKLFESQTVPFTMIHQLAKKQLVQLVNTFIHYSTSNCEQYRKILNNYNHPQVTFVAQSWATKFSWLKYCYRSCILPISCLCLCVPHMVLDDESSLVAQTLSAYYILLSLPLPEDNQLLQILKSYKTLHMTPSCLGCAYSLNTLWVTWHLPYFL